MTAWLGSDIAKQRYRQRPQRWSGRRALRRFRAHHASLSRVTPLGRSNSPSLSGASLPSPTARPTRHRRSKSIRPGSTPPRDIPRLKSFDKRIDKLGDHLSPTEIVLRWLQETLKFGSMNDLGEALATKPDSAWPLFRLPKEAERAAKASMPDMPKDKIDARVREYVRDVVSLWRLHLEVNGRIDEQFRPAAGLIVYFLSKLRSRSRERASLSDARDACRDLPYPLDAETAAAVEAALEHRVVSWNCLRDAETIEDWVLDDPTADEYISDAALASTVRRVERRLKALVRSKVIRSAKRVSLSALPHAFLSAAPLLDGRWIDTTVLELAEFGVILADGGFRRQESEDPHPLAGEEFVQLNQRGEPTPVNDESWLEARRIAAVRVRGYRGRRRVIDGRDYVELSLYQRWRKRSLGSRLDAATESGFLASDWNKWVKNQKPAPALAGVTVQPLDPLVDADDWTVHDSDRARSLQAARANLIANLLPDASDPGSSTAVVMDADSAGLASRGDALELLVRIEGLPRAVDRIRARYFKNHEIVFADRADALDTCRTGIHVVLSNLEEDRGGDDSWIARLSHPSIPDEGESADSDYADHEKRVQERISHAAGNTTRELVHRAHFEALNFVGEFSAAQAVIDKELEATFG